MYGGAEKQKLLQSTLKDTEEPGTAPAPFRHTPLRRRIARNWELYLIALPPLVYIVVFKYIPIYGAHIAFKHYNIIKGIWASPWVGFDNFRQFFNSFDFWRIFRNTIALQVYFIVASFPMPILLALSLNAVRTSSFRRVVQTVTYAPHFISVVVMSGMIIQFLAMRGGIVNTIISGLGLAPINFMGKPGWFPSVYVWSGVWQQSGWNSIIYLAALSAISPELHEAAIVDGASRLQRIWHIDLAGILPTATIMLILTSGQILFVEWQKVLLLQNPLNLPTSEIIHTYIYKIGIIADIPNYSLGAAVGLFLSTSSFLLLLIVNKIAKTYGETSLW